MSDQQDLNESEQQLMERLQPEINAMLWRLESINQTLALEVVIPDYETRNAYLEAASGDLKKAVSLAQWGIPPALAVEHPDMDMHDLARLAARLDIEGDQR